METLSETASAPVMTLERLKELFKIDAISTALQRSCFSTLNKEPRKPQEAAAHLQCLQGMVCGDTAFDPLVHRMKFDATIPRLAQNADTLPTIDPDVLLRETFSRLQVIVLKDPEFLQKAENA